MVSAGLSSVVQSLQAFRREDCGSDSQEQGKTQVSAGTLVILLVTWNVNVGSFPALPCLILLSMGTNFRIVAVPCLGHVRCIGDSWVLIILRGWCIAGMWQQSLQHLRGALHPLRSVQVLGVFRGGCVFDFSGVFHFVSLAGQRQWTADQWFYAVSLRLCPGGWVHSFPCPLRALLLRLVWVPTCLSCWCFPAEECFEVTFEEAFLGWRFDRLIAEMVCFCFTPICAKTGAGPRPWPVLLLCFLLLRLCSSVMCLKKKTTNK